MEKQLTEDEIYAVLDQIKQSAAPMAARQLEGDHQTSLLIVRELRRRGLIDGKFLDDSTRPGDQHGPFLYDAARLTAT